MQNLRQEGDVIDFTAPAGGVISGNGYQIGRAFVVAAVTALVGVIFPAAVEGVFVLPKNNTQALTEGALVYWDNVGKKATTTAGTNVLIGFAVNSELAVATTATIRLNGAAN